MDNLDPRFTPLATVKVHRDALGDVGVDVYILPDGSHADAADYLFWVAKECILLLQGRDAGARLEKLHHLAGRTLHGT